ncbi:DUF4358 domain-containing protein [Zongyangia hominis]|uniref:DUF4358 domain-containing protein n=1 Tax=Zongyangia hominis TaxID=2763677 RepID=A0A926IAA0_9FIRM|nr:DUF4358 domain-containing protein [Zongyangia hominis]MBC8570001.1 DUF4358 domain-containing protein [Zongyangia hominis]
MKKLLAVLLAAMMTVTLFAGCAQKEGSSSSASQPQSKDELKEGVKLSDIVQKIDEEIGIAMPGDLTKEMLADMYDIGEDMVEDFSGKFAQVIPGVDEVVVIKAKDGKVQDVKAALEKRKEARIEEQYLPDMKEKAELGRVVVKGNYAALLIVGDSEKGLDKEIQKAEDIFLSFFA